MLLHHGVDYVELLGSWWSAVFKFVVHSSSFAHAVALPMLT